MPIYEYCCEQCGHSLDVLQKMSDAPISLCPNCQQHALTKLMSASGFRLSGNGWYETDFKSGTDKKRNLTETPSSTESTGTGSGSTKTASAPAASGSSSTAAGAA